MVIYLLKVDVFNVLNISPVKRQSHEGELRQLTLSVFLILHQFKPLSWPDPQISFNYS